MADIAQEMVLLQQLIVFLQDIQTTHYANLAATVLLVYDHIITFSDEVEYMWPGAINPGKVLFLWNRYYYLCYMLVIEFVDLNNTLSTQFCHVWGQTHPVLSIITTATVEFILSYRVYALFGKARWVTVFLLVLFGAEIAGVAVIMSIAGETEGTLERPGPFLAGCYATNIPSYFAWVFVPPLVASAILFGMTAVKTVATVFRSRSSRSAPLMTLFLRDGAVYFALISMVLLVNLLMFVFVRQTLSAVALCFCYTTPSIFCSRLLLNVRKSVKTQQGAAHDSIPMRVAHLDSAHSFGGGPLSPRAHSPRVQAYDTLWNELQSSHGMHVLWPDDPMVHEEKDEDNDRRKSMAAAL